MRKVLLASILVVVALASCGVTYAYWTDSVSIDFTVSTGTLGGAIVSPLSSDPPGTVDEGVEVDVACTEVGSVSENRRSFPVLLTNGYTGYVSEVLFSFENTGTIPEKISSLAIDGVEFDESGAMFIDLDDDGLDDVLVTCDGLEVEQVFYVGDVQAATLTLSVIGPAELPELEGEVPGVSGSFVLTVDLMQWNVSLPSDE